MLQAQKTEGLEAGTDEAGRGCLAGPVTAAAVILPLGFKHPALNDSKKLTAAKRQSLRIEIEAQALSYAVAHVFPKEIDSLNILNAAIKAMHLALAQLHPIPEHIVVDGNRFHSFRDIPFDCIVKGDGKYQNIAAASILAKTYRDDYMAKLSLEFPAYHWQENKGYPTTKHREALKQFGPSPHHRKSFQLLPKQLQIPF